MPLDVTIPTLGELLTIHGRIGDELIRRGVARTGNNPCSEIAETLYCRTFGWERERNSKAGFDARAPDGTRIQIKARRVTERNPSRQSGTMRRLERVPFDRLAGIVFDAEYRVLLAFEMDHSLVESLARHSEHVKGSALHMRDALLDISGVVDRTATMRTAAAAFLVGHG